MPTARGYLQVPTWQVCEPLHTAHVAPLLPQACAVLPPRQSPAASQHPLQIALLHLEGDGGSRHSRELPPQICAPGHAMQSLPPLPHAFGSEPATQVPAAVQQPMQVSGLHSTGLVAGPQATIARKKEVSISTGARMQALCLAQLETSIRIATNRSSILFRSSLRRSTAAARE